MYSKSTLDLPCLTESFLVDNLKLSDIMGPVPIMKFWDSMNNLVATTYHMLNVFQNTQPVLTTQTKRINTARISTFGLLDSENNQENMFFSLDIPREKELLLWSSKKTIRGRS